MTDQRDPDRGRCSSTEVGAGRTQARGTLRGVCGGDAVVAPGSRSAPITLALARDDRIRVQVVLDERSAAFRALGIGLATGRPAVVCCTSGTAAANFHPAVLEASHARVPLLVVTADRPPELRDSGAGQTIDQTHLYGRAVRWFCEPGPPTDEPGAAATWRALASRAVAQASGPPAGPVHLNLAFREPLLPSGVPLVDAPGRADGEPWTGSTTRDRARRAPVTSPGSRSGCAPTRTACSSRAGARAWRRRPRNASPPRRAGRCWPIRSRSSARGRTRCRPTKRCCARPVSATRTGRTSWCGSAPPSRARSRPPGSIRRCPRCSSTRSTPGSILTTRRATGTPSTPTSCCAR